MFPEIDIELAVLIYFVSFCVKNQPTNNLFVLRPTGIFLLNISTFIRCGFIIENISGCLIFTIKTGQPCDSTLWFLSFSLHISLCLSLRFSPSAPRTLFMFECAHHALCGGEFRRAMLCGSLTLLLQHICTAMSVYTVELWVAYICRAAHMLLSASSSPASASSAYSRSTLSALCVCVYFPHRNANPNGAVMGRVGWIYYAN